MYEDHTEDKELFDENPMSMKTKHRIKKITVVIKFICYAILGIYAMLFLQAFGYAFGNAIFTL